MAKWIVSFIFMDQWHGNKENQHIFWLCDTHTHTGIIEKTEEENKKFSKNVDFAFQIDSFASHYLFNSWAYFQFRLWSQSTIKKPSKCVFISGLESVNAHSRHDIIISFLIVIYRFIRSFVPSIALSLSLSFFPIVHYLFCHYRVPNSYQSAHTLAQSDFILIMPLI